MDNYREPDNYEEQNGYTEIDLGEVLYFLKKRRKFIAIMVLIGLLLGGIYQAIYYFRGQVSKSYKIEASAVLLTQNEYGNYPNTTKDIDREAFGLTEDMTSTAVYVLHSRKLLNIVIKNNNLNGLKAEFIDSNLTVAQEVDTQVIKLTLSWRSADEGKKVLRSILVNATPVLREVLDTGRIAIIEEPYATRLITKSTSPILISVLLALIIALAVVFMEVMIRPTVITIDNQHKMFGLDLIGTISKRHNGDDTKNNEEFKAASYVLINKYRGVDHPVVYLTSTMNGEGRTVASVRMATHLASIGYDILLIDLDVTDPSLGKYFEGSVEYDHSVNALYRGEIDESDAVVKVSEHLDIMPLMLDTDIVRFDRDLLNTIKRISSRYECTIIDAPSMAEYADTLLLNKIADNAILIIGFDMATRKDIQDNIATLRKAGTDILGCMVINEFTLYSSVAKLVDPSKRRKIKRKKGESENGSENGNGSNGSGNTSSSYDLMRDIYGKNIDRNAADDKMMMDLIEYGLNSDDDEESLKDIGSHEPEGGSITE